MKRKKHWSLVMFKGCVRKGRAVNKSWVASPPFQAYPWRRPDLRWLKLCQKREKSRITVLRSVISSRRGHTKTVKRRPADAKWKLDVSRLVCVHTRVHAHRAPLSHTVSWFGPNGLDSALKGKFGRENFKQVFNSAYWGDLCFLGFCVVSKFQNSLRAWKEVTEWCRAEQEKALHQHPPTPLTLGSVAPRWQFREFSLMLTCCSLPWLAVPCATPCGLSVIIRGQGCDLEELFQGNTEAGIN